MDYKEEIRKLRKEKNAVILAHFYQRPEIQEVADFVEDSLGLSLRAEQSDADIIVFAGVHFMAETAKIVNPEKKVLIPDMNAGCSLADSCKYDDFMAFKEKHPGHVVISYINCSAEIKSISDIICTSGNAADIVNSFPEDQKIIFTPDKNLGNYINNVTGRNMVLWDGTCKVHDVLAIEKIMELKEANKDAKLIAHPECKTIVLEMADFIGSTSKMLDFVRKDDSLKFIVATESGIIYKMKESAPEKEFIVVPSDADCLCNECEYMKLHTLEKLYLCLRDEKPEIIMEKELLNKAAVPIMKMLELSRKKNK